MGDRMKGIATIHTPPKYKEMPDRKWVWSLGQQAELFVIGTIPSSVLKDDNELNKEWPITANTFRLVPMQWDFVTSVKGKNTEGLFEWLDFSGDIREPSTRFAAMLVSFANAKLCGLTTELGHKDEGDIRSLIPI